MPRFVAHGDLRFGFLRLSTIKKCPHMLKSDHRELRNSKVKFKWVGMGRWWWYEGIVEITEIRKAGNYLLPEYRDLICMFTNQ